MDDLILAVVCIGLVIIAAVVIEQAGKKRREADAQRELDRTWRKRQ